MARHPPTSAETPGPRPPAPGRPPLVWYALAAVIFVEKVWRYGEVSARIVGGAFLILAALCAFGIWVPAGLSAPMMAAPMGGV